MAENTCPFKNHLEVMDSLFAKKKYELLSFHAEHLQENFKNLEFGVSYEHNEMLAEIYMQSYRYYPEALRLNNKPDLAVKFLNSTGSFQVFKENLQKYFEGIPEEKIKVLEILVKNTQDLATHEKSAVH